MSANTKTIFTLDIGSNKICCCIATADISLDFPKINIKAYYPASSKALKNGVISNMDKLIQDVGNAVESAEEMAQLNVDKIVVSFSGLMCESGYTKVNSDFDNAIITEQYLKKIISKSFHRLQNDKEDLIHIMPVNYSINGENYIKDPVGQYADVLGVDIHYIKTNRNFKRTVEHALTKNRLKLSAFCNSAYASGLACLTEDEKEIGVTIIDIGEDSCDIAMFERGCLLYSNSINIGGFHITKSIRNNLKCSLATAEKLKILKGDLNSFNDNGFIEYKEDGSSMNIMPQQISKSAFINIIRKGVFDILKECNASLEDNPFYKVSNNIIVITGGVSSTNGIKNIAEDVFNKPVRIGRIQKVVGMPSSYDKPSAATTIGLVRYAISELISKNDIAEEGKNKKFKKIVEWLKENL
ncbi:MAG: cell division protein FtsA [Alphaproteobacteria bacterium]|nr:cell division protein FtsA [Alphaproteobacteria bacterium]